MLSFNYEQVSSSLYSLCCRATTEDTEVVSSLLFLGIWGIFSGHEWLFTWYNYTHTHFLSLIMIHFRFSIFKFDIPALQTAP